MFRKGEAEEEQVGVIFLLHTASTNHKKLSGIYLVYRGFDVFFLVLSNR